MKCKNCQKSMPDGYKYCPKCGTRMSKANRLKSKDIVKKDYGLSNPISWIGIIGFLVFALLLFTNNNYEESKIYIVISCLVGILYPICNLYRKKLDDDEKTIGWIAVIVGLILSVIMGVILKENTNEGFLTDFLDASSSKGLFIVYFILWNSRFGDFLSSVFLSGNGKAEICCLF